MFKSMKNYFRQLAEGHDDETFSRLLAPFLEVAGNVYGGVVTLTRSLYERHLLPRRRLPFPVISVGNLTWGGTGKTPFVEYLARKVSERGKTALILTRGYSHDEVEQYRQHLPRAIIGVGKNRLRVAQDMAKQHRIDLAILDDGLQHWPIERDVEIVTVNVLNPFGNGKLLPRGMLREPVTALRRAGIIVLSHTNLVERKEAEKLKGEILNIAPQAFVAEAYLEPLFLYRAKKRSRISLDRLENQRVTTFSAVGAPRSFQLLLAQFHIKAVRNFEFSDHHAFSDEELEEVREVSRGASADEIITTEKDFFRCPERITNILNPLILATRLKIGLGEGEIQNRIWGLLGEVRP